MKERKSTIFEQFPRLVPVPLIQRPNGIGTINSGIGTTHQNRIGTSTGPSGTYDAPNPRCPLTTRQPTEFLYVSYRETNT